MPSPLSGRVPVASTSLGVRGSINLSSGARTRRSSDPTSIGNDTQTVNGVATRDLHPEGLGCPTAKHSKPCFPPSATAPMERALLRRSVGALSDERPHCAHCHRTPLIGERVYFYAERSSASSAGRGAATPRSGPSCVRSPEHKRASRPRPESR